MVKKNNAHPIEGSPPGCIPGELSIPKIIPPSSVRLYSRLRLFELFDRCRERGSLIWVSAPAGSGKTSLATSYIAARKLQTLWYQVDAGDGDIASFFFYLGLATRRIAPQHEQPMPVLKSEYLADLPTFSQNYFRELYRRLPRHCIIVLDNFQKAPLHSPLHELLPVLLQELPQDLHLIVLSREVPPASMARLRLNEKVAYLDSAQLQLSDEESQGVSEMRLGEKLPNAAVLRQFHQHTQGWAAGLVLLLEQARVGSTLNSLQILAGRELLFDYFAGEVFAQLTPAEQDFLLKTALLSKVSGSAARELSCNLQAETILEDLTRRNYFTVRHAQSYEYHPLFREFLLSRLISKTDANELKLLQLKAGHLLFESGLIDDAVELLQAAHAWQNLIPIVLQQAPSLIAQGRSQVLARWVSALPQPICEDEPWLNYWLGMSQISYSTSEARTSLERAHYGFISKGVRVGILLTWAGIVETLVLEFENLTRLEPWIKWLNETLTENPEFPSATVELQVVSSMAMVVLFCREKNEDILPWINRATTALVHIPDLEVRCRLATCLALHASWTGDLGRLAVIAGQTQQWSSALPHHARSGIGRQYALYCQSLYQWTAGLGDFGSAASEEALLHAVHSGIHVLEHHLVARAISANLCLGNIKKARTYLFQLHVLANSRKLPRQYLFQYHNLPGLLTLIEGDNPKALCEAEESLRISQNIGATVFHRASSHLVAAHALALMQQPHAAQIHLESTLNLAQQFASPFIEFSALLLLAFVESAQAYNSVLSRALALGREHHYFNTMVWMPAVMSKLCCLALEHDIEQAYVQKLIRTRQLEPLTPPIHLENWPWPLRLYTLGRFSIVQDGQPLRVNQGKGHKKPIEMLQTLIALGGRKVGVEHIIEHLWPDAEGDAAANLFKITLHRLRKLLLIENAIEFAEARVTLNPKLVWVDSWSLTRLLSESRNHDSFTRSLSLYQGHFLLHEPANNSAIISFRDKQKSRMLGAIKTQIATFESHKDWESMTQLSAQAISLDDLDEDFHSAAIRAYLACGRKAEALRAFELAKQRYAQMHLKPSHQLQSLILT